ncbi:hypothetical protein AX16_010521 [Volvariella volvacea WC 439]|nr:hypothetical protein AX16_010521 [Volvariella volvacea WC 439]
MTHDYQRSGPALEGLNDTPIKAARTMRTTFHQTLKVEAAADVEKDLRGRVFVSPRDKFLDAILPIPPDLVARVRDLLVGNDTYKDGKWSDFSTITGGKKEDTYYKPFIKTCNHILGTLESLKTYTENGIKGKWVGHSQSSILSPNRESAKVYPDCVLVTDLEALDQVKQNLKKYSEDIETHEKAMWNDQDDGLGQIQSGSK